MTHPLRWLLPLMNQAFRRNCGRTLKLETGRVLGDRVRWIELTARNFPELELRHRSLCYLTERIYLTVSRLAFTQAYRQFRIKFKVSELKATLLSIANPPYQTHYGFRQVITAFTIPFGQPSLLKIRISEHRFRSSAPIFAICSLNRPRHFQLARDPC